MPEREKDRQESSFKGGVALKEYSPLVIATKKSKQSFVNQTKRLSTLLFERLSAHRQRMMAFFFPLLAISLFWGSAWVAFLIPGDLVRYQCYATTFWFGSPAHTLPISAQCAALGISSPQPAFHLLPREYPPGAILPFSVPLLVPQPYYALAFALFMLCIAGLICWLLVRFHSYSAAICFLLYLVLGANVLFQVRFDLLPAICMLICLIAAERKHWSIAYSALALGVLFKLYPLVALPAVFIAEQEASGRLHLAFISHSSQDGAWWRQIRRQVFGWQWKHVALFTAILLGVTGCFALLNPQAAILGSISYYTQRPTQIESLASSILWLAQYIGMPSQIIFSYGSINILSPLTSLVSWTGVGFGLVGCFCIFRLQWKHQLQLGQAMIALLCLSITTGKVFSPQYLIWLIPLVAYVGASRIWLCFWTAACILTSGIYIFYYSHLTDPAAAAQIVPTLPGFFEVVGLHNALFLFITLAYLLNWFHARQARPFDQKNSPS